MKFSEQWLREWVNPPVSSTELADQLTMAGLEVEGITSCRPEFSQVTVARVKQVEKHPDADRLSVCQVETGDGDITIICGAENVRAGGYYALANIGASLPDGIEIKATKLKGVISEGMLCSGAELGLSDDADSVLELGDDAPLGSALEEYLELNDQMIEISLTPNRGDCLSINGIAREVGVLNKIDVSPPSDGSAKAVVTDARAIKLNAPEACPRYVGRIIKDIDISRPSPAWLVERLRRSGIRGINAVVDIGNYVMLELGQPMHAFDNELLNGTVSVRYAGKGETITLLDGQVCEMTDETLVIADEAKAVAMAGIMGGLDTAVTGKTRHIFLESAFFSADAILGRAREYKLHTDSSHRFERGVDYELQTRAVERATQLILEVCGGVPGPVTDVCEKEHLPKRQMIRFRPDRVTKLLGAEIEEQCIQEILQHLGMNIANATGTDDWQITCPSFRFDITMEADLIEEVARVYGYDNIPGAPITAKLRIHSKGNSRDLNELRQILLNRGYHEAITYSFVDKDLQNLISQNDSGAVPLLNPISSDLGVMRQSLWPGLLTALKYNLQRQQQRVRLFEYGRVFNVEEELSQEPVLAGIVYGNIYPEQWDIENTSSNLYDIKSDIETLLAVQQNQLKIDYRAGSHPALHPGQSCDIFLNNQLVGVMGAIHPRILRELEIPHACYAFECCFRRISEKITYKYKKLSKFPFVRRDISILVDNEISLDKVMSLIRDSSPELLENLELFDVYHGEGIDLGKKSLALGLTFQASSSTLIDEEVEGLVNNILEVLHSELGATLRQ